jgi:YfiH family protein
VNHVENHEPLQIIRISGWEKYPWLQHGFSTRPGGVSSVYGGNTLNLGWTKEDDPKSVTENRRRFLAAVVGQPSKADGDTSPALVAVRQIHSAIVRSIRSDDGALEGKLATPAGKAVLEGDGLITALPEIILGVGTADCVPVLIADIRNRVVAAFHAGWRGTAARIVEHGVNTMRLEYDSQQQDLLAAVGPSIGPCCYSVGDEVQERFYTDFSYASGLFRTANDPEQPTSKIHLDLWKANQQQLLDAGLDKTQITVVGECTACSRDAHGAMRYFSHRAEHGAAGRMLNVIGIAI